MTAKPSTSFKTPSNKAEDTVDVTTSAPETTTIALPPPPLRIGSVSGEVSSSDIVRPSLNIVQAVGPLSEHFQPGQIVLNRELVIAEPEKPITLMVLAFNTYYIESLPYDSEEQARTFNTLEEVKAAGLHIEWINDQKPPAAKAGRALVALQKDGENGLYPYTFDNKSYALAEWVTRSSAYTRAGKLIVTASQWNLKDGLQHGSWTLCTRREKLGQHWVWVPVLKAGPRNSPELVEFFESLG